jgi:hypothetical protein
VIERAAHQLGEPHEYEITCRVCGQVGVLRLTVDPETAEVAEESEPWVPKGEVGTLEGPPIVGTTDTINAGPPQPHLFHRGPDGLCVDCQGERDDDIHRRLKRPRRRPSNVVVDEGDEAP